MCHYNITRAVALICKLNVYTLLHVHVHVYNVFYCRIKNSPSDLFSHVVYDHVSVSPQPVHTVCQWSGCTSKAKRMLPSLLRHVQVLLRCLCILPDGQSTK